MIAFAAQIACLTASGAASGAAARPSTICATAPGTVGWEAVAPGAVAVAGGVAGGSSKAAPPGPWAASAAGAALKPSTNSTHITIREFPRTTTLFRRPAGLADGLARKEPAPPVDDHGISPNNLGPPFPGPSGDSALHTSYRTFGGLPERNTEKWGSSIRPD